jgi:hypothetical protein
MEGNEVEKRRWPEYTIFAIFQPPSSLLSPHLPPFETYLKFKTKEQ